MKTSSQKNVNEELYINVSPNNTKKSDHIIGWRTWLNGPEVTSAFGLKKGITELKRLVDMSTEHQTAIISPIHINTTPDISKK